MLQAIQISFAAGRQNQLGPLVFPPDLQRLNSLTSSVYPFITSVFALQNQITSLKKNSPMIFTIKSTSLSDSSRFPAEKTELSSAYLSISLEFELFDFRELLDPDLSLFCAILPDLTL